MDGFEVLQDFFFENERRDRKIRNFGK